MKLKYFTYNGVWNQPLEHTMDSEKTLVLIFSTYSMEDLQTPLQELNAVYKNSTIIGSSTAGNICMDEVMENSLVVTVVQFSSTTIKLVSTRINSMPESYKIGQELANKLKSPELKNIFLLSNGLYTNGSQLTDGIDSVIDENVDTSGALAGDDAKFESTYVIVNENIYENGICGVGFYGDNIRFRTSSKDGLDKYGIKRLVTRSQDNVLFELDNKPALQIYKKYLGEKAAELPSSGLYFPLSIEHDSNKEIIRTILSVNPDENSIIFAGDIPEGSFVSFMKANYDRLIEGALQAAHELSFSDYDDESLLVIAISCIARKLVLKQRVEEELEAVLEALPKNTIQTGMYSFGEISPAPKKCCELHNQTMTLTAIWEKDA